jgi:mannose-6-phosphate isomerase
VMMAPEHVFKSQLDNLIRRYESTGGGQPVVPDELKELVLRLHSQFPGDIGIFCAFFLNYVKLSPGEAIFLGAGEPHAYVSGGAALPHPPIRLLTALSKDIVECMATSDNVIRAGLTPKLRDVPNLVAGLTYVAAPPSKHVVKPSTGLSPATRLYDPPIPEFAVLQTKVGKGNSESHAPLDGPSIAITAKGSGKLIWPDGEVEIKTGEVFFVGAGTPLTLASRGSEDFILYRAFVEAA